VYRSSDGGLSWQTIQKMVASGGETTDEYGYCVSVFGSVLVVGAYSDDNRAKANIGGIDKSLC
jgi:hypothetical protein